jgi:signal transduction histidine kinase
VAEYNGAAVFTVEDEDLVLVATRELGPEERPVHHRIALKQAGIIWAAIGHREPVIIGDVREDAPLAHDYRGLVGDLLGTSLVSVRAALIVPLLLKERAMGLLLLTSSEPDFFTARHATLALAVANQAAMALENARLYEQAQEWAALEERQRLARELHDSVSQALYGISLGVHTARTLLDRDPRQVREPLEYVLSLADAALAEMRALIFELRPESLEREGLCGALTQQASRLHARYGLAVSVSLCDEPTLPLKAKQELYRIAQEAMQNTVKHAQASAVDLRLERAPEAIVLEVCDDGIGFDPADGFPGHLGLRSMRERVMHLDGTFQIESAPGQGTRIQACIPVLAEV